jgi:hypothetical protein
MYMLMKKGNDSDVDANADAATVDDDDEENGGCRRNKLALSEIANQSRETTSYRLIQVRRGCFPCTTLS